MNDLDFDKGIQSLGLLMKNDKTCDAFSDLYMKLANAIYTEMMVMKNVSKVRTGAYSAQAKIIEGMLEQQLEWLEFPRPKKRATKEIESGDVHIQVEK